MRFLYCLFQENNEADQKRVESVFGIRHETNTHTHVCIYGRERESESGLISKARLALLSACHGF